ncbi:hypothetical protein FQA39_LY19178 [Lamprigera yunnana]|nr:hypothetical protein FQA39_LY19178 [Lamprigera yunnana]
MLPADGRLIAFDKDVEAIAEAGTITDTRFSIRHQGFSHLCELAAGSVAGVLLDLGLSFYGPLDMRMDTTRGQSVAEWLQEADMQQIAEVIRDFGEERFAGPIAKAIVARREAGTPVATTADLAELVAGAVKTREAGQNPATRTFQAFRIFINAELQELEQALEACLHVLAPRRGAMRVISFTSPETASSSSSSPSTRKSVLRPVSGPFQKDVEQGRPGGQGQAARSGQADGHALRAAGGQAGGRGQDLCLGQAPAGLDIGQKIKALDVKGIHLRKEYKRQYPEGESAAHVVGFTNVEDHGQEGMELAFDKELAGKPGSRRVIKDRLGRVVEGVGVETPSQEGQDIQLSIDSKVQFFAYQKLRDQVAAFKAKAGSVVVMDAHTGEVLALANYPSYDPNNRARLTGEQLRNRAITDTFEPGSTMKPITVGAAIELGRVKNTTIIDTTPGRYAIGGFTISDTHNYGA